MPDWVQRVTAERSRDLLPGETVLAATYYTACGGGSPGSPRWRMSSAAEPPDRGVLAITDQRVLGFGYKQGLLRTTIDNLAMDRPRDALMATDMRCGSLISRFWMNFHDGSDYTIEIPRAGRPVDFASSLELSALGSEPFAAYGDLTAAYGNATH